MAGGVISNLMYAVGFKLRSGPLDEAEKKIDKMSKGVFAFGAAAGLAMAGFGAAAFSAAANFEKNMAKVQMATGQTDKQMEATKEVAKSLYGQNFGENWEDLSNSISTVAQVTGQTGAQLQATTKDALLLNKAFGYDVNESVKAADTLMKQFGVTSGEAMDLLAQGTQKGLNKTDELLDTANEYAVSFKSLGFSATEMFDTFAAGNQAGAFQLDKVGDAVKEFNIRAKDGSKTTIDAYKMLGLNADQMTRTFAEGGPKAKQSFQMITQMLGAIENPVERNTIGVALMGSQFEDLEAKTITAMGKTRSEFKLTHATMEELNRVRFKDPMEAFQSFGRTLETAILIPVGQKLLPTFNKLGQWLQDNQGRIEAFGNALGAKVGNEIDYVVGKVQEFWPVVKNAAIQIKNMAVAFRQWEGFKPTIIALVSAFVLYRTTITTIILVTKAWATWLKIQSAAMAIYRGAVTAISAVTKVWTVVQGALNVVMSLNPIGLLIIGIGLLIGVIILAWNKSEGFRKVVTAVWNAIKVAISATIAWLAEAIPAAFNAIVDFVVFWGTVFIQLHVAVWTAVYNFVATIVTTVWSFIVSVWTRISTSTSTAFNAVKNFIVNTWNSIKNSVFTTLTSLWNKVKEIWDRIVAFFKGINLFDTGKQLIQSLIDGVVNMADTAIQKVKGIATDIGNAVTDAFSFSSPSVTVTPSVDGSHAKGLPRVPWDGYIAELHEGERVLTKEETDDYDSYQHGTPDTAPARATYSTTKAQPERSTAAPQGELKVSLSLDIRADASDANMAPNIAQAVRAEIEKVLEQVARAKGVNISYGNN